MDVENIKKCGKHIVIYGAGKYARIFYLYLYVHGLENLVDRFVVTHISERMELFGFGVYEFDGTQIDPEKHKLIIAISSSMLGDVLNTLMLHDISQYEVITKNMCGEMEKEIIRWCCQQPLKQNRIVFYNFWGLGYFDNCKYIAEELYRTNPNREYIWLISSEAVKEFPAWINTVEENTLEYYETFCTARVVVSNVDYPFVGTKREGQYFISTWHGAGPFKKTDWAVKSRRIEGYRERLTSDWSRGDLMVAATDHGEFVYQDAFLFRGEIQKWGYPRNDIFFYETSSSDSIKRKYQIPLDTKVVLYAPTFRNELLESGDKERLQEIYDIALDEVKSALEQRFGGNFCVLYRFHHYVYRYVDISHYLQQGIDVTYYQDMQELLVMANVLITDYSSSMWDFSLTRKPVFLYYHDAEEYEEKYQGFYLFPDQYPYPKGHTTKELCVAIRDFDDEAYQKSLDQWFATYGTYDDGHASERVAERIIDVMEYPEKYGRIQ